MPRRPPDVDYLKRVAAVDEEHCAGRKCGAEASEDLLPELWVPAVECADAQRERDVERRLAPREREVLGGDAAKLEDASGETARVDLSRGGGSPLVDRAG